MPKLLPDNLPIDSIPDKLRKYIAPKTRNKKKNWYPDRYEFYIYRSLRDGLDAGDISCRDSLKYSSFEDDLLSDEAWEDKERLIENAGLHVLKQPITEHIVELKEQLEKRLLEVNQRIAAGENECFQFTKRGRKPRWTLQTPRIQDETNHHFYDEIPHIDIGRMLGFVQEQTGFMAGFQHILEQSARKDIDERLIMACLVAWGTNMGLGKMASISDIRKNALSDTSNDYLRPETLKAANDHITNAYAKLSIFRYYNIDGKIHSSSDGQQYQTVIHTPRSRHSPKYFGMGKGIAPCTLVVNNIAANAKTLGSHDHESHYLFDILYNNTSDVKSTIHSTDSHGANQVNFAILSVFGYQFAPRFKDIHDTAVNNLCGFEPASHYSELIIKPKSRINSELVIDEWDNCKRIFVSLANKITTQSIIIRKLSSHARKNRTKRALTEYNIVFQFHKV